MGHNRSGVRRTARMKRAKKHEARLIEKMEKAIAPADTVLGRVKHAAAGVAHAVGAAVHAVADTLTGKKKTPETPKA